MARTDADQCRATGIWPVRPMTPWSPCRHRALLGHQVLAAPSRSHGALSSRSSCSAPSVALLTCWPRDKRERRSVERLGRRSSPETPKLLATHGRRTVDDV
jgi:hypothetical protein